MIKTSFKGGWLATAILLILILVGCEKVTYTPIGKNGTSIQYFIEYGGGMTCDRCHEKTALFKKSSKGEIVCDKCFKKLSLD